MKVSYQYMDYHCKDKTVSRPSHLYNRNTHTWSLYWDGALCLQQRQWLWQNNGQILNIPKGIKCGGFRPRIISPGPSQRRYCSETGEFPTQRASKPENVSIWWRHYAFSIVEIWNKPVVYISATLTHESYRPDTPIYSHRIITIDLYHDLVHNRFGKKENEKQNVCTNTVSPRYFERL